jgi:hypothetical protein
MNTHGLHRVFATHIHFFAFVRQIRLDIRVFYGWLDPTGSDRIRCRILWPGMDLTYDLKNTWLVHLCSLWNLDFFIPRLRRKVKERVRNTFSHRSERGDSGVRYRRERWLWLVYMPRQSASAFNVLVLGLKETKKWINVEVELRNVIGA